MSRSSICNGLARPANYSIFAREWTCSPVWLPTASTARPAFKPMLARDVQREHENNAPLQQLRRHKKNLKYTYQVDLPRDMSVA